MPGVSRGNAPPRRRQELKPPRAARDVSSACRRRGLTARRSGASWLSRRWARRRARAGRSGRRCRASRRLAASAFAVGLAARAVADLAAERGNEADEHEADVQRHVREAIRRGHVCSRRGGCRGSPAGTLAARGEESVALLFPETVDSCSAPAPAWPSVSVPNSRFAISPPLAAPRSGRSSAARGRRGPRRPSETSARGRWG